MSDRDNSAHMQPTDQISMLVEYVLEPSKTSGARYQRVTTWSESNDPYARGTHLVGERVHWYAKRSRQTEVTNLQFPSPIDKQILGFEVSVQHPIIVTKGDPLCLSAAGGGDPHSGVGA